MKQLEGKNIILGITGSIAAYKSAMLARLLIKQGAKVKVVMTPCAKEFITPVTMATLSQNTVLCDFFHHDDGAWNSHVDLGLWADLFLIAPASANTMAKMAFGIADNLLLTTYLSVRCQTMIAPAMDVDMYHHRATQQNLQILRDAGHPIVEPGMGELASGLTGKGRMEEPEQIVEHVVAWFKSSQQFAGKKVLITAGPTYEAIDPVRFIGNHSTGKMGFAIAEEFARRGAMVTLVSGPSALQCSHGNISRINVVSAAEMLAAAQDAFAVADITVLSAAVADFTPVKAADQKIKSNKTGLQIDLKPSVDIAQHLGAQKRDGQLIVGFALETQNEIENAKEKIRKKNFDCIVLNSLQDAGAGFGHNTNKVCIIDKHGTITNFDLKPKTEVASDIANTIYAMIKK